MKRHESRVEPTASSHINFRYRSQEELATCLRDVRRKQKAMEVYYQSNHHPPILIARPEVVVKLTGSGEKNGKKALRLQEVVSPEDYLSELSGMD